MMIKKGLNKLEIKIPDPKLQIKQTNINVLIYIYSENLA